MTILAPQQAGNWRLFVQIRIEWSAQKQTARFRPSVSEFQHSLSFLLPRAARVIGQALQPIHDLLFMWIDDVLFCFSKIFSCKITLGEDGAYLALASIVQILVVWCCEQLRQGREIQEGVHELVNLFLISTRDVV